MIPLQGTSTMMLAGEVLKVERFPAATYKDGRPSYGAPTCFEKRGVLYPMSSHDLLIVPEGDRFKEQFWWVVKEGEPKVPNIELNDMVVRHGANYQVQSVERWGSFARARIMRIDTGPRRTP